MFNSLPSTILKLKVIQSVKYSITAQYDKIMKVILYCELCYLWLGYDNSLFTPKFFKFCFYISKGS